MLFVVTSPHQSLQRRRQAVFDFISGFLRFSNAGCTFLKRGSKLSNHGFDNFVNDLVIHVGKQVTKVAFTPNWFLHPHRLPYLPPGMAGVGP